MDVTCDLHICFLGRGRRVRNSLIAASCQFLLSSVEMATDFCIFDQIFSAGVPHIFEEIIFYLDYKAFKACLEVNSIWNELLTSERYKAKGKRIFKEEIVVDEVKLWTAANMDKTDEAKRLLATGMVDVNLRNVKNNQTILQVAAHQGNIDLAQLLLECNADPNKADVFGNTPLHLAARKGHKEVAHLLIRSHADLNAARARGETALHRAVHRGHLEMARLLVESGAKVNVECKAGRLPLHLAAFALRGQKELLQLLTESGADINVVDKWGKTPLHLAAESGGKEMVKALIKCGADVNLADKEGRTPLHCLQPPQYRLNCKNIQDLAILLIDGGADPKRMDNGGDTPAVCAILHEEAKRSRGVIE